MTNAATGPQQFFVLHHTPGPGWQADTGFREQPRIVEHVRYMGGFMGTGQLALGGPFLDNSGGMMILRAASLDEAQQIADADPCVTSGLLNVAVREWRVVFANWVEGAAES